jgi:hypothetical protein
MFPTMKFGQRRRRSGDKATYHLFLEKDEALAVSRTTSSSTSMLTCEGSEFMARGLHPSILVVEEAMRFAMMHALQ